MPGVLVAVLALAGCQGGPPPAAAVPPPQPPVAPVAAAPAVPPPPPPATGSPAAAPARGKMLELSYAVRAPKKGAQDYWRKLEHDVRRLAGVGRTEPPIPDFAPLPHEPKRDKAAKQTRRGHARPAVERPTVVVDRKRGVLTVRATAERQQAIAEYLRHSRSRSR